MPGRTAQDADHDPAARRQGAFSYSVDGATWSPSFETPARAPVSLENLRSQSLWVRLIGGPQMDVVDLAYSGQPAQWIRSDAEF